VSKRRCPALTQEKEVLNVESSNAVFVIGCPRSGTSVLAWALAAHPNFWTSSESDFILELCGRGRLRQIYKTAYERPDHGWLEKHQVSYAELAAYIGLGIDQLFCSRARAKRWVDATPGYTLMAEDLALMFPRAKFLHIIRDGRAVVSSMLHSGFSAKWARDFKLACETWVHFVRVGRSFQLSHPEATLEIRQEKLAAAPGETWRTIFHFLGEDDDDRSAQFVRTRRINSSYGNVNTEDMRKAKDPLTAPQTPWREWNRGQRNFFLKVAAPTMRELGYALAFD
jgi:hypothetical protein